MADVDLERRVEILEVNMEQLRDVPARLAAVESQIVLLGDGIRGEFSAVRAEMQALGEGLRAEMRDSAEVLRGEMRDTAQTLRTEMRVLNDETCAQMRVLHEEVISRIVLLQEGSAVSRPTSRTPRSRRGRLKKEK